MDTVQRQPSANTAPGAQPAIEIPSATAPPITATAPSSKRRPKGQRSALLEWLIHDIPFIAMLLLALVGVVFRLPVTYWVILTPVFAVISIAEGWSHFLSRNARLALIYRVALDWCALLLAIYLLYNSGVQGVMNTNAISLAMVILLALGTFVAGSRNLLDHWPQRPGLVGHPASQRPAKPGRFGNHVALIAFPCSP
jgi:hypothetical protein